MKIIVRAEVHIEVPANMEAEARRAHKTGETIMAFTQQMTEAYGRRTAVIVSRCELKD